MEFRVKSLSLSEQGANRIDWAWKEMQTLQQIRARFESEKPLKGLKIAACLHVTAETACLATTLKAGGAEVYLAASNPLSTQDDVAAALVDKFNISVFAVKGDTREEYYQNLDSLLNKNPDCTIDDGCDLVFRIHENPGKYVSKPKFGAEETTTGVLRLKALEKEGKLLYPILAVNQSKTKYLFDNRYGTGQSVIDGILRSTNHLLAGKECVVCGYGWCGKGISKTLRGLGARVRVVEIDPIKALEALMDGYEVGRLIDFASTADIVITATGNSSVVRKEHFDIFKDGVILANAGHFDVEIDLTVFENLEEVPGRPEVYVTVYRGKRFYILAKGRLVNLACAEGHPSAVMDLSFSNQALGIEYMLKNYSELPPKVYTLPDNLDSEIAAIKLRSLGVKIEELTEEQKNYIQSAHFGT